jgi:putative transposase
VGNVPSSLAGVAQVARDRQTRYGHRLASKRFPALLDVEEPSRAHRTTGDGEEDSRADPRHERFERTLGSAEAARRTAQAGIEVSQATVAKYMVKHRKPPSQTWRTFLENHAKELVSVDFFVVPTVSFRILYVFLVLSHERRRVLHFNVTEHPTAEWTSEQLVQAFPWDTAPRYLLRDRDAIYGDALRMQATNMEISEVLTAPRSPWQSPYVERLIGSIRRECLDHVIVMDESSLRRHVARYLDYYHGSRSHISLGKDSPDDSHSTPGHGSDRCSAQGRRSSSSLRAKSRLNSRAREGMD